MDTIADYTDGSDKLRLLGTSATAFSSLILADSAAGATVSYGGSIFFTLTGTSKAALDSNDFLFA